MDPMNFENYFLKRISFELAERRICTYKMNFLGDVRSIPSCVTTTTTVIRLNNLCISTECGISRTLFGHDRELLQSVGAPRIEKNSHSTVSSIASAFVHR